MLTMKFFDGIVHQTYTNKSKLSTLIERIVDSYRQRKIYTQTIKELSKLSDRELLDIGLTRSEIYDLAMQSAYGDQR